MENLSQIKNLLGILFITVNLLSTLITVTISAARVPAEDPAWLDYLNHLKASDTCKTVYSSKLHGYDILEYKLVTTDQYVLTLHRLIHPSDTRRSPPGPRPDDKKPYLLLHGLVGSSASFVRNVKDDYRAQMRFYDADSELEKLMNPPKGGKADPLEYLAEWQSTADQFKASHDNDKSLSLDGLSILQKAVKDKPVKQFAVMDEVNYDADSFNFGRHFRKVHRKFQLPKEVKSQITNSLAFTLSNFGYDVWLINLRASYYSRDRSSDDLPKANKKDSTYWKYDINTLAENDLKDAIDFVREASEWKRGPIGLVGYSYSNLIILNLLSRKAAYQETIQPVLMIAPSMFSAMERDMKLRLLMRSVKKMMAKNGPFPARLGHSPEDLVKKLLCKSPIAGNLCRMLELIIAGKSSAVGIIGSNDQETALVKRDLDCGQTSLAVFHQILDHIVNMNLDPNFKPFVQARLKLEKRQPIRRSVIIINSEADEIATPIEVRKFRESALKILLLAQYTIKEPNFGHTDFLFSKRNQYLVNGEIGRMLAVFDFLLYARTANQPTGLYSGF